MRRPSLLAANIEGNRFTADQLADLVNRVLGQRNRSKQGNPSHAR
jgi:hypothetical protein